MATVIQMNYLQGDQRHGCSNRTVFLLRHLEIIAFVSMG